MMLLSAVMTLLVSATVAQNDADVLILGAGTAGLNAGKVLSDNNVSFIIIEGADQIGGRVRSEMFGGKMVELGPQGLYGKQEQIDSVVSMYGITGKYADYESVVVRTSDGNSPEAESETSWYRIAMAQNKTKDLYEDIKDGKIQDMSIRVALEYGDWFPKTPIDDVIEIYDYDYEFSKIPELISTQGFEAAIPYQDAPYLSTDARGLQDMLKRQADEFLEENDPRLKLNEVVENITHSASSVSVTTKSGKTFTGKYAIITFSMGVLKSGSVNFIPPLPEWKMNIIHRTSMDVFTQIYVNFASGTGRFWDDEEFILHANPRRGYYPIFWNMEADGLHPAGTNMIAFAVMGEEARRVERSDKDTVKAEITDVLRKMYGMSTPEPEDILVTRWLDDPLTMGSFTSRQVGDTNPMYMDALMSPVGNVYFAGEAYHNVLDGFMEGARLSAEATAMKLHDCMMNKAKCKKFDPSPRPSSTPLPPTCGAVVNFVSVLTLVSWLTALFVF